ncbi:MAG: endonuclease/exonuclease/phosphatase [Candidatus Kariarchaeaceae archaeon]|jgi:hypothetical protein
MASFNIRKLGSTRKRNKETWDFLAYACSHFDLISIQEIMQDLRGVYKLKGLMGPEYDMVISDTTGVFPGDRGLGERLAFIYRKSIVKRADVVTDISLDRSKILETLAMNNDALQSDLARLVQYYKDLKAWEDNGQPGDKPKKPKTKLTFFLDFIRAPYCVAFQIVGQPNAKPYQIMVVNAHLYYGNYMIDRKLEFDTLMEWILNRVKKPEKIYFPNFVLLGDLNLDFNNPKKDRADIVKHMKTFNDSAGATVNVNFPFIDIHPSEIQRLGAAADVYRTNAKQTETFDQIGLFFTDTRFPTFEYNDKMGSVAEGPDFGVFKFVELFCHVLHGKAYDDLTEDQQDEFVKRFEHEVSDHVPLWLRLPLPVR